MRVPLPRNPWIRASLIVPLIAGAAALFWWRGPEFGAVREAFHSVSWKWVVVAILFNLFSTLARSLAWRTVIHQAMPPPHPRFVSIFSAFCIGLLGNAVLPGRVGELARVGVLTRRIPGQSTWATLGGTVVAHRVFDIVAVMLLIGFVILTAPVPDWAVTSMVVLIGVGIVLLIVSVLSARRHHRSVLDELGPARRLLTMARHGLGVMRAPLPAAVAIFYQCIGWALQLLAVYAAMRAFSIDEPLAAAGLVLVLMNVAGIFPLWPGNVGLVQAAVALPLVSYGISYAHGFAFGIGLQAIEASVGVGLGLLFLAREGLSFAMLKRMPEEEEEARAEEELEEVPDVPVPVENGARRERARVPG
jgi:uncharacterized membrane protein YbhN (UPF0104 family)